jgi:hypothetical protein
MRKIKFPNFNHDCRHGALTPVDIPEEIPFMVLFQQLTSIPEYLGVHSEGRAAEELVVLERFCKEQPAAAKHPAVPFIFLSMAADAFQNKQYGHVRNFLRPVFFFEAFQMYDTPGGLSVDLHRQDGAVDTPGMKHLAETLATSASIKGVYEHISKRVTCRCFEA